MNGNVARTLTLRGVLALLVLQEGGAFAGGRDVARARTMLEQEQYTQAETYIETALRKKQDVEAMTQLRAMLDDARYGAARQTGTKEAYYRYLQSAPEAANSGAARLQLCGLAWREALAAAQIDSDPAPLLAYQASNPGCQESDTAWLLAGRYAMDRARKTGTAAALRQAMIAWEGHPELPKLASEELRIHEEEARVADTPEAILSFLVEHPDTLTRGELQSRVEVLLWQDALESSDQAPVAVYLAHYPEGPHRLEAQALLQQRATGLLLKSGDAWLPMPPRWTGPTTLVYKATPGRELHSPVLVLYGLHALAGGSLAPSAVLDPRLLWAHNRLGLQGDPDQPVTIKGIGPGKYGEWTFDVPLPLHAWAWRGAVSTDVRMEVTDGAEVLERRDIRAAGGVQVLDTLLRSPTNGASTKPIGEEVDPVNALVRAVAYANAGDSAHTRLEVARSKGFAGAQHATAGARPPVAPLMVALGDESAAPGSYGNAFVPLMAQTSNRDLIVSGSAARTGSLFLAGGRSVGTARFDGARGTSCGSFGLRGNLAIARGISAQTLLGNWLYVVVVGDATRAAPLPLTLFMARWPSLGESVDRDPSVWLRERLSESGTAPARVAGIPEASAVDLDGDGLPDWIRGLGDHLAIVSMNARGALSVQTTPLSASAQVDLIMDLNGDGLMEIVTRETMSGGTRFQIMATSGTRSVTTVDLPCKG